MPHIQFFNDDCTTASEAMRRVRASREKFFGQRSAGPSFLNDQLEKARKYSAELAEKCAQLEEENGRLKISIDELQASIKAMSAGMPDVPEMITVNDIQSAVCSALQVSRTDLISSRKSRHLMKPRQIAAFLCCRFTAKSLPQLGIAFRRDHTTILHSRNCVEPIWKAVESSIAGASLLEIARLLGEEWDRQDLPKRAAHRERQSKAYHERVDGLARRQAEMAQHAARLEAAE